MYDYLIRLARTEGVVQAMNIINHWLDTIKVMGEPATEAEAAAIQVLYNPTRQAMLDIINGRY